MKLAGKVLVVTGAGSGIGRAVTLEAVRRRARVAAVDLNATTLEETATLAAADGARPCRGGPYGSVRAMVGPDAPRILTPDQRPRVFVSSFTPMMSRQSGTRQLVTDHERTNAPVACRLPVLLSTEADG